MLFGLQGVTGFAILTVVTYAEGTLQNGPWAIYELSLFGAYWIYAVSLSFGLGALLYNAFQGRNLDLTPPLPEFVSSTTGNPYLPGGAVRPPALPMSGLSHQVSLPAMAPPPLPDKSFASYSTQHDWEKERDPDESEMVGPTSRGSNTPEKPPLVRQTTLTFADDKGFSTRRDS